MVLREDLLSRLRKIFGLNLYEVKIWTALLSRGISTAGELSSIAGVPRSRTYDILESLEKKGFVLMKLGKPIKFIAIKPEEVIERAKQNFIEEAKERGKILDEIKNSELMKELENIYSKGIKYVEVYDISGAVRGRHNIHSHLSSILLKAQKEIYLFLTEEGLKRKYEVLKPVLEKLNKKGVKIKIAAKITSENYKVAKELSKIAEIRSIPFDSRIVLIDGKSLMFMLMNDKEIHPNFDTGVWINSEFFSSTMKKLVETVWESATPLKQLKFSQ
ncbi:MAG: helix-turn-helix domain-containing protein [Candidatus Pacearchaeota archaeon]